MMAAGTPSQLALAANDETARAAFLKDLFGGERQFEFEHVRP